MGSIAVPSAQRVELDSVNIRAATLPNSRGSVSSDPDGVADLWVESFNKVIKTPDLTSLSSVFLQESYWRDQLCLTWDLHTLNGPEKILEVFEKSTTGCRVHSIALDKTTSTRRPMATVLGEVHTVRAFLIVQTDVGSGAGLLNLVQEDGNWKAFTLFTCLHNLKGYEENIGTKRPQGVEHGSHSTQRNWLEQRQDEENFANGKEPTVFILGSGQAGLGIAARLKMLGISSLLVDRNKRVGDNWRNRYHHLVLHDPVWMDHLPYLPFPPSWPIFTPKDKLGDWFESYVKLLELNVWIETTVTKSSYDDGAAKWTIEVERVHDGKTETRVLHPKHVIQATGHSGEANFPSHIKGISDFKGEALAHSSTYNGAVPSHGKNKEAIVVGCCNSGHDIAQDLHENGYAVTMVQRSTTHVIVAETNLEGLIPIYSEGGPSTYEGDILFHGIPYPVQKRLGVDSTRVQQTVTDGKLLAGLEKAGFKLDRGPDESGLWIKYIQRGGGYYIDVGCSQLIVDGHIKVKQGIEISEVNADGLTFADGTKLTADTIIFATGYKNMQTQCRSIFGDAVADRIPNVWGLDAEGEIRTMWRHTGHPGFWFMGGNLALCRINSLNLALTIKALEEGLCKYDDY